MIRHGGAFVFEHRILPLPHVTRWVLVRGFYERDASGKGVQGRGIVVDMTEGRQEDAEGGMFFMTNAVEEEVSALDRVTKHVLAGRRALDELEPASVRHLRTVADILLLELAHPITRTMVPVLQSRAEH